MTWLAAHWIHLTFVAIYLGILVYHASVARRRVHGLDDYLIAGRRMGGGMLALSYYATFMSTNTFIGAAGKSWDVGLIWCAGGVILAGLCCVSWLFVAPRLAPLTRKYGSLTVADFLGFHYNSSALRRLAGAIICFASIAYLVAIYRGASLALENLLEIEYVWAAVLICIVVTAYTLAGGFESVVMTDSLQGLLMVVGAVGMAAAVLWLGGGLGNILESLHRQDPAWTSWQGKLPLAAILALNLSVGLKHLVEPRQLTRFYGLKDDVALRRGAIIAPLLVILTYVCLLPLGAMAHVLIPADAIESSDQVVPHLLASGRLFGPVLSVLFLLVLLSAAMSSIDSVLLVAASAIDHDWLAVDHKVGGAVRRIRVWVVVVSLISMGIAISPLARDIMQATAFSGALYGACFLPALVLGLYWRATARAALVSVSLGAASVIGWSIARQWEWTKIHEVYVGLTLGLGSYVLIGLLTKRESPPLQK